MVYVPFVEVEKIRVVGGQLGDFGGGKESEGEFDGAASQVRAEMWRAEEDNRTAVGHKVVAILTAVAVFRCRRVDEKLLDNEAAHRVTDPNRRSTAYLFFVVVADTNSNKTNKIVRKTSIL